MAQAEESRQKCLICLLALIKDNTQYNYVLKVQLGVTPEDKPHRILGPPAGTAIVDITNTLTGECDPETRAVHDEAFSVFKGMRNLDPEYVSDQGRKCVPTPIVTTPTTRPIQMIFESSQEISIKAVACGITVYKHNTVTKGGVPVLFLPAMVPLQENMKKNYSYIVQRYLADALVPYHYLPYTDAEVNREWVAMSFDNQGSLQDFNLYLPTHIITPTSHVFLPSGVHCIDMTTGRRANFSQMYGCVLLTLCGCACKIQRNKGDMKIPFLITEQMTRATPLIITDAPDGAGIIVSFAKLSLADGPVKMKTYVCDPTKRTTENAVIWCDCLPIS